MSGRTSDEARTAATLHGAASYHTGDANPYPAGSEESEAFEAGLADETRLIDESDPGVHATRIYPGTEAAELIASGRLPKGCKAHVPPRRPGKKYKRLDVVADGIRSAAKKARESFNNGSEA